MTAVGAVAGQAHIQLYAQTAVSAVRWRLLGGNNRELGRGTGEYSNADVARRAIRRLQQSAGDLEHNLQRGGASSWSWVLSLDGVAIATSGHRYDRLIRCRQGLAHFVEQLARCDVGPGVMLTQSRRWASPSSAQGYRS